MSSSPVAHDVEERASAAADAIRELAAHVHAAQARLATMVSEFATDGWWNAGGDWRSMSHWLVVNCGLTRSEAITLARVASATNTMPKVMEHARAGEVSLGVAAMAARVATPEIDEQLATILTTATAPQISRLLARYRDLDTKRRQDNDDSPDDEVDESAYWRSWFDENGRWRVNACAPAEIGALLDEAYQASKRAADRVSDDGARPTTRDALRELADLALDSADQRRLRRDGGEHFNVTVLIDLDTLLSGVIGPDSICRLESGPHVTPDLVRRLAEEGTLQVLWHQQGVPLKLGKEIRLANRDQRRALRFRDGRCSVPGCDQKHHLHAHHVEHHPDGPTDIDNLVLLCSFHHRLIHHGGWSIETDGFQRFRFRNKRGELVGNWLVGHTRREGRPPPGPLEQLAEQLAIPIDARTAKPCGGGAPLTDYARDVYMHALLTAGDAEFAAAA